MSDALETIDAQTAEAHASLLESRTEPKRKHGARVPPERRATIYALHDVAKLSQRAIADRLGMSWVTVAAVLNHRDTDAILARNSLGENALGFAKNWIVAAKVGASKGRHEPARDALYALNVVSPPQQAQQNQQVTVILNGGDAPVELRVGATSVAGRVAQDEAD